MTIKDIAREAGYAVGTVSRVLNQQPGVSEEARRRVLEVVKKHDFHLNNNAKLLKQQYSSGIAIIVKGRKNMLFAALVEMLQKLITKNGYACFIYYITEDEHEVEQAIQVCRERQPRGILFLGSNQENFREKFHQIDIPCVIVTNSARELNFANLSSVCVDDTKAAKRAISYLISLGHRNIGVLGGEIKYSNPAKARYIGCLKAFEEQQIPFEMELQFTTSYFTMEGGYMAMKELLKKNPTLSAVFAMSDVTALGAIRAIKDSGLSVPEDISVVGYDGIEIGQYMVPKLTTIQQPGASIAERCVDILIQSIEEEKLAVCEQIDFTLIEGESTKRVS